MPTARAAAIVLAAAVLTGATAGASVAAANVNLGGVFAADPPAPSPSPTTPSTRAPKPPTAPTPSNKLSTPPPSTMPEPEPSQTSVEAKSEPVRPTKYVEVQYSTPEPPEGGGGGSTHLEVPVGWTAVEKASQWRDLHDPTGNLNLRVRSGALGDSDADAVAKQVAIRKKLKGFTELGRKPFTVEQPFGPMAGIEFRFSWSGSKGTRYAVERYFGGGHSMIGGYGWNGQLELVEPAVDRAMATFWGAGD